MMGCTCSGKVIYESDVTDQGNLFKAKRKLARAQKALVGKGNLKNTHIAEQLVSTASAQPEEKKKRK